jgi:signal transduction histidine kinase
MTRTDTLRSRFIAINLLILILCFALFGLSSVFFTQYYLISAAKTFFLDQTRIVAHDIWPELSETEKIDYLKQWHIKYPDRKLYWYSHTKWMPWNIEASNVDELVEKLLKQGAGERDMVENNFHTLVASVPVDEGILVLTLARLHEYPKYLYLYLALLMLSFVAVTFLCLFPLTNKIIILINRLKRLANSVSRGNFGEIITVNRRDELGDLANSFNSMSQQLAEVEKQNYNLIAGVSHELRSPLTRIRVNAEQMELSPTTTDVQSHSKAICSEVDQLNLMVNNLLQSAKMRIEPQKLDLRTIDLCKFLPDIIQRYMVIAEPRKIQFNYKTKLSSLIMTIDPGLLTQAITNLIDNAITATQNGSAVSICLSQNDQHCIIEVNDKGPGINDDQQKLIFDQFYRIDPSRSRNTGGVGLGLTIVKQIISAHKGDIELYSQLGRGSTFRLLLPLK